MAYPKTPTGRSHLPISTRQLHDFIAVCTVLAIATEQGGKRFASCPFCGGTLTNQISEHRFHCHQVDCRVRGTAVDLVASLELDLVTYGDDGRFPQLNRGQMRQVVAWMTENNIPMVDVDSPSVATMKVGAKGKETRATFKPELDALWVAASGTPLDSPCRTWLDMRKLDKKVVLDLDLARSLPDEADAVPWAKRWRGGHRLLLPVHGSTGDMESLRGRWVLLKEPKTAKGDTLGKAMPPKWGSGTMSGVVLANPVAVKMLRAGFDEPITLIVVEGEPDYLTWATTRPDLAVIGIWPGAWTQDIADRVPDGSTIIVRTDHDESGVRYAAKVVATLGSRVTLLRSKPDEDDPKRDENALHMVGLLPSDPAERTEPVESVLTVVPMATSLPFHRNKDGQPKANRTNAALLLREDPTWADRLWFNTFDIQYYLDNRVLDEPGLLRLAQGLGKTLGLEFSKKAVEEAVVLVGRENERHVVTDWLTSLEWDGTDRLDRLLPRYFGATDSPTLRQMGPWWMMGAAMRGLTPGTKMDYTLVLVGKQGIRKSTAVRTLAVRPNWFQDTSTKVGTKDGMLALQGCWLMELAELSAVKGVALEAIKAFLTSQADRFRAPYGRKMERFERTTAFIATTNDEYFLIDPTGNRRFWPVTAGTIDIAALELDREQLWAEAVHRVTAGERYWPTPSEDAEFDGYRARYVAEDPWLGPIVEWLDVRTTPFRMDEVMRSGLGMSERDMLRGRNRVGGLLRRLGYSMKRKRVNKNNARLWCRWT